MPHRLRKTRWYRGSRYHGWGQVGQHRKSGSRGGYGRAGLKKHKWFYVLKYEPDHFGKHGFKSRYKPKPSINVGDLNKIISHVKGEIINLVELGYEKLLGKGNIEFPVKVIVKKASEKAVKKIKEAGGEIIILGEAE